MSAHRPRNRRAYPDTIDDVRSRLIAHVASHVSSSVTDSNIVALLQDSLSWSPQGARALDNHLTAYPDALTKPDAHCPRVLVRLAENLHSAGFTVTRPRCARCGKVDPSAHLPRLTDEGRCCEWCVSQYRTELCSRCGQLGFPCARRDGGPICRDCYNKTFVEPCARCGRVRAPTTRNEEGSALCWSCAPRTVRQCSNCGEFAVLKTGKRKQALCRRCYKLPARTCGVCGETAELLCAHVTGTPTDADDVVSNPNTNAGCAATNAQRKRCGRSVPCADSVTADPFPHLPRVCSVVTSKCLLGGPKAARSVDRVLV